MKQDLYHFHLEIKDAAMPYKDKEKEREYRRKRYPSIAEKSRAQHRAEYARNKKNHQKRAKAYRASSKFKEKSAQYSYSWRQRFKETDPEGYKAFLKNSNLMRMFGITLDDYNQMFENQRGCCAICGTHQSELSDALAVDHDHETGDVRELLCGFCNRALGNVRENPDILVEMLKYIERHKGLVPMENL